MKRRCPRCLVGIPMGWRTLWASSADCRKCGVRLRTSMWWLVPGLWVGLLAGTFVSGASKSKLTGQMVVLPVVAIAALLLRRPCLDERIVSRACLACGYELGQTPGMVCPECGQKDDPGGPIVVKWPKPDDSPGESL